MALVAFVLGLGITVSCKEKKIGEHEVTIIKQQTLISDAQTSLAFKDDIIGKLQIQSRDMVKRVKTDSLEYWKSVAGYQKLLKEFRDKNEQLRRDNDSLATGLYCKNMFGKIVKCRK